MGSLMAGWSSPNLINREASFTRSTSFTKAEIETYKKSQRDAEAEHAKAATELAMQMKSQAQPIPGKSGSEIKQVDSPASPSILSSSYSSVEDELEKIGSYKDWWTKSNWAFLNDSSMDRFDAANFKYTAQFDVAAKTESSTE